MRFLCREAWKKRQEFFWGRWVKWHRWFAWRPVYVDQEWVWLETVYRRRYISEYVKMTLWEYCTPATYVTMGVDD